MEQKCTLRAADREQPLLLKSSVRVPQLAQFPVSNVPGKGEVVAAEEVQVLVDERRDSPDIGVRNIEREFISARTKEALACRKAAGLPVGRPKGRATKLMLDDRRAEIVDYFSKGVSKRSVAKILGCSPTTLYSWIRRRRISGR